MEINKASRAKLKHVHPDLVRVVERCAKDWKHQGLGWIITQGPRTLEEQKLLVKKGASKTMRSRHLIAPNGYAHAVDFAMTLDGKVRWDWPLYSKLAVAMKAAAKLEKVPLEWGGDWTSFRDGPHFQLPWLTHPGTK
jgi:peptidoglycan L-alanyl-D-glutamate endopeptidase CwlK